LVRNRQADLNHGWVCCHDCVALAVEGHRVGISLPDVKLQDATWLADDVCWLASILLQLLVQCLHVIPLHAYGDAAEEAVW
jgi:hypothetical protein